MRPLKIAVLLLALSTGAVAQATFHVTGVEDHTRQENEPGYNQALRTERVTGVVAGKRYHLSEPRMRAYRFEVRKNYPVLKLKPGDKRIDLQVADKKGHERKETLTILAVEEVEQGLYPPRL